jgi:polysaccharide biosynthesis/export protein
METMIMQFRYPTIFLFFILPLIFSCTSTKKAIYFDIDKDSTTQIQYFQTDGAIQKNDLLSITVSSLSREASEIFNVPNTIAGSGNNAIPGGYLVNDDGNIQFPVLGNIKAIGLTKEQLQQNITNLIIEKKLLLDPIVSIRSLNYKVTVLGEVARPTVINVPSEKINLLEAIGFAGDLTLYANRSNVLIIREENNQRTFKLLNLNSNEVFSSPYFYLKPNDIVYVKPNKARVANTSNTRLWLPVVFSALSVAAIIFDRVFR